MSGHVGSLTPQQEEALSKVNATPKDACTRTSFVYDDCIVPMQFKSAVSDIPNKPEDNDYFYLRWLRGTFIQCDTEQWWFSLCVSFLQPESSRLTKQSKCWGM